MMVARFAEFRRLGVTLSKAPTGSRGVDLEGRALPEVQWKSHNYKHLMEQPTIFYAIVLTLALMGFGSGINSVLAWGYVGFRVAAQPDPVHVNIVAIPLSAVLRWLRSACSA